MFLVDTSVISHTAPRAAKASRGGATSENDIAVRAWIERNQDHLYLSAVTIAEIQAGVRKLAREGAQARAEALNLWLFEIRTGYQDRVIALDAEIAVLLGNLMDRMRETGRIASLQDAIITATASQNGFTILTANAKDFDRLNARFINPFAKLPADVVRRSDEKDF